METQKELNNDSPDTHCIHRWDQSTGIFEKGRPFPFSIKGRWIRTCIKCGYKEHRPQGVFKGWFNINSRY